MPAYGSGRHEYGQNFLVHQPTIERVVELVGDTDGPIIEIGPGDGALTLRLEQLGRPLTAIEIDQRHVARLRRRVASTTGLLHADFLRYRLPLQPHVIVGNLPFHQTTAVLRRLLHSTHWSDAVLLVQWEVARRRAGVGGATMMTAQWWPWYEFALVTRVPASAFRPRPSVDGGVMTIRRRPVPLIAAELRKRYQAFVHAAFTGKGRGITSIVTRAVPHESRSAMQRCVAELDIAHGALPRDLTAADWAALFAAAKPGLNVAR